MTKEALKMALEALEAHADIGIKSDKAITAIKEALAQPEQPKIRTGNCLRVGVCASEGHKIQPQHKPLTDEEIDKGLVRTNYAMQTAGAWRDGVEWTIKQLKEKNT